MWLQPALWRFGNSAGTLLKETEYRANVSTFTLSRQELLDWAETVLVPTAELAFAGDGEYHCGEWCQFCKAKADCRERARVNMELARYEFRQPPLLTDEEVEEILGKLGQDLLFINHPVQIQDSVVI